MTYFMLLTSTEYKICDIWLWDRYQVPRDSPNKIAALALLYNGWYF
jgi:hypothetical protein